MNEELLIELTAILMMGFLCQWVGWRLGIPSILLLLVTGLVAGPLTGFLQPVETLGDPLIFPVVSLGVAIILFEGGLTLNFRDLRQSGATIFRLISVGAAVCWLLVTWLAVEVLGLQLETALMMGAILVITGPTVVGPMLRQIRPRGKVNRVLKWEGIINDPVGAVLAVLIMEAIVLGGGGEGAQWLILKGIGMTLLVGVAGALAGGGMLVSAMRRGWIPDFLHIPATLAVVVTAFTLSNHAQPESGLLTVTLMGILLANQRSYPVRHILEFKENLQVLLIAGLFIVLGARVELETLREIGWRSLVFVAAMILVVRPLTVLVSALPSSLNWKERIFLMFMAPRGIVVTTLASLFAFRLGEAGFVDAERMFAEVLNVVLLTVLFYGSTAGWAAKKLGLAQANPRGLLLVGAHPWALMIAAGCKQLGLPVALLDSNPGNVQAARQAGLTAYAGNIHSADFLQEIDFSEMGYVLALTANDEINAFAEQELGKMVGLSRVYRLRSGRVLEAGKRPEKEDEGSHFLFGPGVNFTMLEEAFYKGWTVQGIPVRDAAEAREMAGKWEQIGIPLLVLAEGGGVHVVTAGQGLRAGPGSTVVCLVHPEQGEKRTYTTLSPAKGKG